MEQYVIKGGIPLVGEVEIAGAKNAALAILAAAIMSDETIKIENLPDVRDINVLLEAIAGIGAMVERTSRSTVRIAPAGHSPMQAPSPSQNKSLIKRALPSMICNAPSGQLGMHLPHPVHFS